MATVICLDDYHSLDRTGRKEKGVTALDPNAQNFEMMYEQAKAIKEGKPIEKPIYNHVTGILDPAETIKPPKVGPQYPQPNHTTVLDLLRNAECNSWEHSASGSKCTCVFGRTVCQILRNFMTIFSKMVSECYYSMPLTSWHVERRESVLLPTSLVSPDVDCSLVQIMVLEGLHPFYDERVRDLYDFKIYLDISDEVKVAWKIQRDMKERGHSLESIKASIEARRPDFEAYIDPQKKHADVIIQVRLCLFFF